MALITEDGTGKADAESYITVAAASTRLANLGLTNWATLSNAEMEQALRRATQFMLQAFRGRWTGFRRTSTQALDWPRYDVCVDGYPVAVDSVPTAVANACADLAFKAASGDLNADLARGVIREKVGPIETEYDRYSPQQVRYPAIEMTLSPFLKGASANVGLVRA
jgi:hypothetical protein